MDSKDLDDFKGRRKMLEDAIAECAKYRRAAVLVVATRIINGNVARS